MEILKLREHGELAVKAASWFHSKWHIPVEEYTKSIQECLSGGCVPQWYVAVENGQIIGGIGVIENDFHDRKDLTPNVCAVYVEENFRCQGIAGKLLKLVCEDMRSFGFTALYLVTDHTEFYERYGWKFLCMVQGDGEPEMMRMYMYNLLELDKRGYVRAGQAVRHDLPPGGERTILATKYRIATGRARTAYRDNDTSVIRSPAIRKAGRLDAYGAAQQAAA